MADSGNRKENPDPKISKITASGEELPTFDGPVQVNSPQKEQPPKKSTNTGNPGKVPAANASDSHLDLKPSIHSILPWP